MADFKKLENQIASAIDSGQIAGYVSGYCHALREILVRLTAGEKITLATVDLLIENLKQKLEKEHSNEPA